MRMVASTLCAVLWCLPNIGHAEEAAIAHCRQRTSRPPESIIVPIDDATTRSEPRRAAIIEIDETLCLAGTIGPDGAVKDLHLIDEASGEPTLLRLAYDDLGTMKALEVQSSSPRPLHYQAAFLHGPAEIAVPTTVIDIGPMGHSYETWPSGDRSLMVFGVRTVEPQPSPRGALEIPSPDNRWASIVLDIGGGGRFTSLGRLNGLLRERGYTDVSALLPTFGLGLQSNYKRLRFDVFMHVAGKTSTSNIGEANVWSSIADVTFAAGYDVVRAGGFSAFGLAGVGVAKASTDARVLHVGDKDDRAEQEFGVVTLDAGAEQLIPLGHASPAEAWTFACDLRGGVVAPFAGGGWHLDDKRSTKVSGPNADAVGARILLTVGIGVYAW